jgi:hypothetical protein
MVVPDSPEDFPYEKIISMDIESAVDGSKVRGRFGGYQSLTRRLETSTEEVTGDAVDKQFYWVVSTHSSDGLEIELIFDEVIAISSSAAGQDKM